MPTKTSPGAYKGTTIMPGSDAEVAAQIAAIDRGQKTPVTPTTGTTPVITADTLKSNATPLKIPATPPSTAAAGLGAAFEANTAATTADLAAKAAASKDVKDASLEALLKSELQTPGEAQLTDTTYKDTVDPAEADLKDINQQIIEEQHSLQRRLEAIDKNPNGLSDGALEQEKQKVQNESIKTQADLSIIQLARQGKYDSAKTVADRAIAATLETQKTKLTVLDQIYQDNKDQFSKDEQNAFEVSQAERQRQLNNEEYRLRAQFDQTIKQNDPLYRAQLAKAKAELDTGNGVTVTSPLAAPYASALNTILGSSKFTKDQKASVITAINTGEDPFIVIKNQAKNVMGQTEATTLTKYETARDTLADIGKQLSEFYAAGGNTNLISGNFEKVVNKLGAVNDPKLVNLATQIQGNLQVYRNAISGTAYSAQEGQDISSIFPGINKSESLNKAILSGRSTLFDSVIDSTYRSALGSAYDDIKTIESTGAKGKMDDKAFVESALTNIGAKYDDVVSKVPPGQKAVVLNKTGEVGYIPESEFDPAVYTPL